MSRSRAVRTVTDPAVLAALAHPTRRRLMDVMKVSDASTVGMLADRLGVAVGSISHHLKVLHQADLVTPAPELARDRREHWWRLVDTALRWSSTGFDDSATTEAIVAAAASIGLERQVELARRSLSPVDRDSALARAAFSTDAWMSLTGAELDKLAGEIQQVLNRWRDREVDKNSDERGSVFVFARGFQAQP
ncbi:MAG: helix-turn-helix transcriptional regulator [Geodermatophilaceae bacterium]|nr:helix-turn-helix transcriptional regulator [Geodermatophilaceae bacterium]